MSPLTKAEITFVKSRGLGYMGPGPLYGTNRVVAGDIIAINTTYTKYLRVAKKEW